MFSLYFDFIVILVVSRFGFGGGTLVLIASVPGRCLSFCILSNFTRVQSKGSVETV